MVDLAALKAANAERWAKAKLTRNFVAIAKSLVASKPTYQRVEAKTGVPWFVIAVIHEREASQRWDTQLGQGDPLNKVSVHVPAGRGPFNTWEEGAYDALVNCAPHIARNTDWSPGGALTAVQGYNGLGYGEMPSPYIWAGTDQYVKGKFIRDHVYDPNVVDIQPGCAALIKTMIVLDPSISFGNPVKAPEPKPEPKPEPTLPTNWWSMLISIFKAIFQK